jgi:transglutaminase superfamily protein
VSALPGAPARAPQRPAGLAQRERIGVLVGLLDDPSPAVLGPVRAGLVAAGRSALPRLRRAMKARDARRRGRARTIVAELERRRVLRRIAGYAVRPDIELERGLFLLSRLERAGFDRRPYVKALDAMGAAVRARMAAAADSPAAPLALAQYLGDELGFVGCETDFNHPDNIYLHRAIEKKRGMPLTLVAIYLLVARRAGLKAAPIALPGRVLLRLYAGPRSLIIDPFLGGKARTRQDCVNYLAKHGLVPRPQWFADAGDTALFHRHVLNLMGSHQARGHAREGAELQAIVGAVNRVRARRRATK